MGSKPGKLGRDDATSLGKGFLVALAGAVLTYLTATLIPALQDAGTPITLALVVVLSVAANVLRKWLTDTRPSMRQLNEQIKKGDVKP